MKVIIRRAIAFLLVCLFIFQETETVWAEEAMKESNSSEEIAGAFNEQLSIQVEAEEPEKITYGDTVILCAYSTGGSENHQYQFADESGQILQEYSPTNKFEFIAKEGQNLIFVRVKDMLGNMAEGKYEFYVEKEAEKSEESYADLNQNSDMKEPVSEDNKYDINEENQEIPDINEQIDKSQIEDNADRFFNQKQAENESEQTLKVAAESSGTSQEYVSRKIILTALAEGGAGEYQYKFTESYNGKEQVCQDYSKDDTYEFITSGTGKHTYYVDVVDGNGEKAQAVYTLYVVYHPDAVLHGNVFSNKTENEYVWRDITLTGVVTGGYGELQYQYTEVYNGTDEIVQAYSNENSYSFRTEGVGKHVYYLDVKDAEGQTLRLTYTLNVVENPAAVIQGKITSNKTNNEYIERDITLTGEVSGGYGKLEYQYTEVYDGKSRIVQEYSGDASYIFQTSGPGVHIYYLDVRDENGRTKRFSYTLNVVVHPSAMLSGKIVNNKTSNEYIWRDITLAGEVTGGYGELEYQYTEVYGGKTAVVRKYSNDPAYSFRTKKAGKHTYYLDVKDQKGQTLRLAYTLNVVENPAAELRGSITSNKTSKEYVWRDVVLTGEISGGYGNLQYQYTEVYNGTNKVVQKYSDESSYSFRTEGPGTHIYYLDVKDENNQTKRFSYILNVVVHPTVIIKGEIKNNKTSNEYIWRDIILSGQITGGYGNLQYRYTEVYNETSKVVQEYGDKSTYEFRTEGPGTHTYYLDVRDEGGQIVRFTYILQVVVHPNYKMTGMFKSNISGNAKENQAVQLTAAASGGYGEKREYRFRESYNGRTTLLQDYSEKSTCNFNINGGGIHGYYVDIRDEAKQIVTLHLTISLGKNGWYYEDGYKFYYINNVKQLDLDGILPKQSSYYIKVNRTACTVTVYAKDGNNGYIIPVKRFACSVGLPSTPTPTGTYYTSDKYRWHTLMGPSYGQYCTRIVGGILFHSVAGRNMTSYNLNASDYNKLGSPASHGCVRLCVRDAKWIYDNCVSGTKVTIYDSTNPGPLGKPSTIKIPAGQTWDPTDPNI